MRDGNAGVRIIVKPDIAAEQNVLNRKLRLSGLVGPQSASAAQPSHPQDEE
jgi:hypothetical protein